MRSGEARPGGPAREQYPPGMPAADAIAEFRRRGEFATGREGRARWRVRVGRIPLDVPISREIEQTLRLHDLHHVATGYSTTLAGEAQIAAWELAGGCGRCYSAWAVNIASVLIGLVVCPRRMWMAYRRGRLARNLFTAREIPPTVGDLVSRLGGDGR
ncbi:hypothetical protein PHYC_01732 [Phycisphaerales bacterium]|nr:hypothetical protein PHYC_01732 [Phycisphaerales bacterium]